MTIHKKIEVKCIDCKKLFLHRADQKKWSGRCKSCAFSNHLKGNHFTLGHKLSDSHKKNIGNSVRGKMAGEKHPMYGTHHSDIHKKRISEGVKKSFTPDVLKKISISHKGERGSNWKGGINPINDAARHSLEITLWKKSCLERDVYTCQKTGEKGGNLQVHHINNFADYPELRTSIENGITLSKESHEKFHSIFGRKNNTREQLFQFLNKK